MANEELKIRVTADGADQAESSFRRLTDTYKGLNATLAESVGHIQRSAAAARASQGQMEDFGAAIGRVSGGVATMGHQVRIGSRILGFEFAQMAQAAGSSGGHLSHMMHLAAMSFLTFTPQVAIAIALMQTLTSVVTHYAEKAKEAREWQIRFNLAIGEGGSKLLGDLEKIREERERTPAAKMPFDRQMELFSREARLKAEFRADFEQTEQRKLDIQVGQAGLSLNLQLNAAALKRAGTLAEANKLLAVQAGLVRKEADAAQELARLGAEERVRPMRMLGLDKEADAIVTAAVIAANIEGQKKVAAAAVVAEGQRLEFKKRANAEALADDQRTAAQQLAIIKEGANLRLQQIEDSIFSERTKLKDAAQVRDELIRASANIQVTAVEKEIDRQRSLMLTFKENSAEARAAQLEINKLSADRVKIELDADNQIRASRRKLYEDEKNLARERANIGGDLMKDALTSLKAQGVPFVTETSLKAEAERLRAWDKYNAQRFGRNLMLTPTQLERLVERGPIEERLGKTGAPGFSVMSDFFQKLGSQFGLRVSPEEMVTKSMEYQFRTAQESAKVFSDTLKREMGSPDGSVVRAVIDGVIRNLELDAQRQ